MEGNTKLQRPHFSMAQSVQRFLEHAILGGLSYATLMTYADSMEDFLAYWAREMQGSHAPEAATSDDLRAYIRDLSNRSPRLISKRSRQSDVSNLAITTVELRLRVVRAYYNYLREYDLTEKEVDGWVVQRPTRESDNPISAADLRNIREGRFLGLSAPPERAQRWLPTADEWTRILQAAARDTLRTEVMLHLAYDAALRREELVLLRLPQIDLSTGHVHIARNLTPGRIARTVAITPETLALLRQYLDEQRASLARLDQDSVFLSDAQRNRGQPISPLRWSQLVAALAEATRLPQLTTATPRLLRLVDIAAGATSTEDLIPYAGHKNRADLQRYLALARARTQRDN